MHTRQGDDRGRAVECQENRNGLKGTCREGTTQHRRPSGRSPSTEDVQNDGQTDRDRTPKRGFLAWKKEVDNRLFRIGLTTSVLRGLDWRGAYRRGMCCSEAAEAALTAYRRDDLRHQDDAKQRREILLTLINGRRRSDLEEAIGDCDESLLRDALRLAGPSQQKVLETVLEARVN